MDGMARVYVRVNGVTRMDWRTWCVVVVDDLARVDDVSVDGVARERVMWL